MSFNTSLKPNSSLLIILAAFPCLFLCIMPHDAAASDHGEYIKEQNYKQNHKSMNDIDIFLKSENYDKDRRNPPKDVKSFALIVSGSIVALLLVISLIVVTTVVLLIMRNKKKRAQEDAEAVAANDEEAEGKQEMMETAEEVETNGQEATIVGPTHSNRNRTN